MSLGFMDEDWPTKTAFDPTIKAKMEIPINPSPAIRAVSGRMYILPGSPDIDDWIPAGGMSNKSIALDPKYAEEIRRVYKTRPREFPFELTPKKQTQKGFIDQFKKELNQAIFISTSYNFPFWSDSAHRFITLYTMFRPGLTFLVEEKEENHKPVLQFTAFHFKDKSIGFLASEMPGGIATRNVIGRCDGISSSIKVPADQEGLYVLRIQTPEYMIHSLSPIAPSDNVRSITSPFSIPSSGIVLSATTAPSLIVYSAMVTPPESEKENLLAIEVHPGKE